MVIIVYHLQLQMKRDTSKLESLQLAQTANPILLKSETSRRWGGYFPQVISCRTPETFDFLHGEGHPLAPFIEREPMKLKMR